MSIWCMGKRPLKSRACVFFFWLYGFWYLWWWSIFLDLQFWKFAIGFTSMIFSFQWLRKDTFSNPSSFAFLPLIMHAHTHRDMRQKYNVLLFVSGICLFFENRSHIHLGKYFSKRDSSLFPYIKSTIFFFLLHPVCVHMFVRINCSSPCLAGLFETQIFDLRI